MNQHKQRITEHVEWVIEHLLSQNDLSFVYLCKEVDLRLLTGLSCEDIQTRLVDIVKELHTFGEAPDLMTPLKTENTCIALAETGDEFYTNLYYAWDDYGLYGAVQYVVLGELYHSETQPENQFVVSIVTEAKKVFLREIKQKYLTPT